jgi:chromosomal replication initiation ATPase DnaA
MERSFAGLRRLVARLDRLSLAQRRDITVPLAREAIAELEAEAKRSGDEGG